MQSQNNFLLPNHNNNPDQPILKRKENNYEQYNSPVHEIIHDNKMLKIKDNTIAQPLLKGKKRTSYEAIESMSPPNCSSLQRV